MEKKEKEVLSLETEASKESFWADAAQAKIVMQKIALLKEVISRYNKLSLDIDDAMALEDMAKNESDTAVLMQIEADCDNLASRVRAFEIETKLSDENDMASAIMAIHAGAGGTESCDWAEMLLRMYMRWADRKGFKTTITDFLPGDEVGVKSVTFIIEGTYAYGLLQSESGVHRLVRISPFDSNKRRHTSFAAVDIIPEILDAPEIKLEDKDVRVDTYRSSGAGGQHVNKTDSAVRMTHIPTGVVVQCQSERSQIKNRAMCLKLLIARLYELEIEKKRAAQDKHYTDKGEITWGNQIRSYVFMPYRLVKDHRTSAQTSRVDLVMDGEISDFIESYLDWKISNKTT